MESDNKQVQDFGVCHKHMYQILLLLPFLWRELCHIICYATALPIRRPLLTREKYVFASLRTIVYGWLYITGHPREKIPEKNPQ